jgi:hypothetical protein
MVCLLLERLLDADKHDRWFETACQRQYTHNLLFSMLVGLMFQVVCRTHLLRISCATSPALIIIPAIALAARLLVRTADPSVPDMGMYLLPERR